MQGGGRTCKFFLELLRGEPSPYLNINIVGVCDTDPKAEGFLLAKEMGIYTTDNLGDLFKIKNLFNVIELTNNREVLLELIRSRPKGVGVLEHNISRLFRTFFNITQRLKSAEQQVVREKMASGFLIQHANERIVVLNSDFTIIEANEAYLKATDKTKEAVIGAYCYEITHGLNAPCSSSQPALGCPMVETLRTGKSAHVIHEHPTSGDQSTYCDLVTYPVKDQNGEILKIIEIWRDITEALSSRWEKRINALKADMKKLIQEDRMVSLGKLGASCVHEINNPIQGLLTLMQEKGYGRIMARPNILVNDNEEGMILTTEKTHVREDTQSWPGEGQTPVTSTKWHPYEAKIKLTITPQISEGDLLRLEIEMLREDFLESTIGAPPDYATSNIDTVVTVPDGSTIILGGLTKLNQKKGGGKVPLFGDIPLVGSLFRSVDNSDDERKLYIFVKANILRPDDVGGLAQLKDISRKNKAAFEKAESDFQEYEDFPGFKATVFEPRHVLEQMDEDVDVSEEIAGEENIYPTDGTAIIELEPVTPVETVPAETETEEIDSLEVLEGL